MLTAETAARYVIMTAARMSEPFRQGEFEVFYHQTARTLHGYLCRLSRDPTTADEVLQEAYMRLIAAPDVQQHARKAYLYTIATNLLRDRWRRMKLERENWELANAPESHQPNLALPMDMETVFEKLSPQDRAALWLAYVEQLSHKEISAILGLKEQSIKVILFRARAKAKVLLEEAGIGTSDE